MSGRSVRERPGSPVVPFGKNRVHRRCEDRVRSWVPRAMMVEPIRVVCRCMVVVVPPPLVFHLVAFFRGLLFVLVPSSATNDLFLHGATAKCEPSRVTHRIVFDPPPLFASSSHDFVVTVAILRGRILLVPVFCPSADVFHLLPSCTFPERDPFPQVGRDEIPSREGHARYRPPAGPDPDVLPARRVQSVDDDRLHHPVPTDDAPRGRS